MMMRAALLAAWAGLSAAAPADMLITDLPGAPAGLNFDQYAGYVEVPLPPSFWFGLIGEILKKPPPLRHPCGTGGRDAEEVALLLVRGEPGQPDHRPPSTLAER